MKNDDIADILYDIASYLEAQNVPFKPFAYKRAALSLDALEFDVEQVYKAGGIKALEAIPGIGKSIAQKIEEYLKTGKIKYYEKLKEQLPARVRELTAIEGIGPKTVEALHEELGIRTVEDLERAAKKGKIRKLLNFGEKSEENILKGIEFLKKNKGRFLLGSILPFAETIKGRLESLKEVDKVIPAGSLRRMKETIGDVDFLATIKNLKNKKTFQKKSQELIKSFISLPEVADILGKGPTKASVRTKHGLNMDLRIVSADSFGSALQYFTGSKEHNIAIRKIAISKGFKLNEYGLYNRKGEKIASKNEEEIYEILGMAYIEPEMREDRGEIGLAQKEFSARKQFLPKLVGYKDIMGDLHCHSLWDGGENTIKDMAKAAMALGYDYIGISDHTKFLRIERGLDEKALSLRGREIDKLNKTFEKGKISFRILQGAETNVLNDGSLDIKNEALEKLDYVIAGVHSNFKMPKLEMTARIIKAIKNPYVKIISHPTGRLLKRRDEYQIDFEKILKAAKDHNVCLEINSYPERLDLNDKNIHLAKETGVKMAINTDSHNKNQLSFIKFGIAQARRGWAEKKDIINTQKLNKLLKYFKQGKT